MCWMKPRWRPPSSFTEPVSLCRTKLDLVEIRHQRINAKLQPERRLLNEGSLFTRAFFTQTRWRRWCLCLSTARHLGLAPRPERQPEGESDRERHAGSDHQGGHLTGTFEPDKPLLKFELQEVKNTLLIWNYSSWKPENKVRFNLKSIHSSE